MEDFEKINIVSALIPFAIIVFIIAIGVVLLNQQFRSNSYKQLLEKESLKLQHHDELLRNAVNVQEDERKRIAMDLHDELGAVLSIARMHLIGIEQSLPTKSEELFKVRELVETTLASTRRISHELMPLNLETFGLKKALNSLVRNVEEKKGLSARIDFDDLSDELPRMIQLGLYRICSELINNTIKYAEATSIHISIKQDSNSLIFHFEDDGKGLRKNQKFNGLGFKSIESRVNVLKGTWEYGNLAKNGFYAHFIFPFETHQNT